MRSGAAACMGALFLVAAADQGTSDAPLDHDLESLVELEHDLGRVGKEPGVNTYKDDMTAAKSVIEGQISSMAQAIAEAVQRSDSVTQMVSQTTGAAIAHLVPELLTRVVTGSLSHELAPLISDKVNELATPAVTDASKLFVLDTMPARSGVPEELTKRLVATLGPALERFSRGELAHRIAAEVLRDVGHLVAGSIGQAVAPAVTVAITRSPQSDYFCYYCLKENLFCEYCSLAPDQLYYVHYYAGYYSTYYAHYYSSALASVEQDSVRRAGFRQSATDVLTLQVPFQHFTSGAPDGVDRAGPHPAAASTTSAVKASMIGTLPTYPGVEPK